MTSSHVPERSESLRAVSGWWVPRIEVVIGSHTWQAEPESGQAGLLQRLKTDPWIDWWVVRAPTQPDRNPPRVRAGVDPSSSFQIRLADEEVAVLQLEPRPFQLGGHTYLLRPEPPTLERDGLRIAEFQSAGWRSISAVGVIESDEEIVAVVTVGLLLRALNRLGSMQALGGFASG